MLNAQIPKDKRKDRKRLKRTIAALKWQLSNISVRMINLHMQALEALKWALDGYTEGERKDNEK